PDSLIRARPVLSVAYAIALLNTGQVDAVEDRLQDAERALSQAVATDQDTYRSLPAAIANARAFRAQALGDFTGAITHAEQALALLPSEDDNERGVTASFLGLAYWTRGDAASAYQSFDEGLKIFQKRGSVRIAICATSVLAQMGLAQGRLRVAIAACDQALKLADQQPEPILQGTADLYLVLSELYYEQGDLDTAHQLLKKGEELRKQGSTSGFDYFVWLVKAQLTAAEGDLNKALEQLEEAARLYRRSPLPNVRPIEALRVRWWLQQGRLTEALGWLQESGLSVDDKPDYLREYEHLTLASILIGQYRQDNMDEVMPQVTDLLSRLLAAAEAQERTASIIKILVVMALAHEAKGDLPAAIPPLERALTLAEPDGHVRIFADCGPPMAELLKTAQTRNIPPTYTQHLLTVLGTWGQQSEAPSPFPPSPFSPSPPPLVEPLSQRELDVLRLLNTELSGPEIARELVVALSTVRTHTKRIYSKLNVTNRRAAVKRAAELGLM
ncbi:MAG: tetratricopeptide repeat protein, partial [Cyanobacteria bacterium J06632_22]